MHFNKENNFCPKSPHLTVTDLDFLKKCPFWRAGFFTANHNFRKLFK